MKTHITGLLTILALLVSLSHVQGQGTAFTYQGRFNTNNAPYTGSAEFQFTLWDAVSGGNAVATNNPVAVVASVANGLFTATLDFGSNPFNGEPRFLQIEVRTTIGAFTTLTPRQPLTPTPYALRALNLTTNGLTAGTYNSALTFGNAGNSFSGSHSGSFSGNGSGLTNVNAATLGGFSSGSFWKTNGNAGANPTNGVFLGNADNLPLEFKVNGQRALRLEPTASANTPNVLAGAPYNFASPGTVGGTIGGGGGNFFSERFTNRVSQLLSTVSGGGDNVASGSFSTVAGGHSNLASGPYSFAVGQACEASGLNAVAIGYHTIASSNAATAMGSYTTASGQYSFAAGQSCEASADYATVGGGLSNVVTGRFATVAGGQQNTASTAFGTVGGGINNTATESAGLVTGRSTVAGGHDNLASEYVATVGGGGHNTASGEFSTVSGGGGNTAYGNYSAVSGGSGNTAGSYAAVPGGSDNLASGVYSFAAGRRAQAIHQGSFVWADAQSVDFSSTSTNQFSIRASGGMRLSDDTPALSFGSNTRQMVNLHGTAHAIGVQNSTTYFRSSSRFSWFRDGTHTDTENSPGAGGAVAMTLTTGGLTVNGVFVSSSDRNVKSGFTPVDPKSVLEKVVALPIQRWHFTNDTATPHLGPVAQDFKAAFGLGADDKSIATVDADGVALAAIQGLNSKLEEQHTELKQKQTEIAELKQRLEALEKIIRNLKSN